MKPALFQQYQAAFNAHLRNPAQQPKPQGVDARRIAIYREIVFNNFSASISACFPVLLSILGKRRFNQLARQCFQHHRFTSPLFADIPKALVDYLQTLDLATHDLPPYTFQLAHYEWVELYLAKLPDAAPSASPVTDIHQASDLAGAVLQLAAAHMLLSYDYAVHLLSKKHAHLAASPTYLLVYRKADFSIAFSELNASSYDLLQRIQSQPAIVSQHLVQLAQESLPHLSVQSVSEFGLQLLYSLYQQQAIAHKYT
ncbi:HvfC family RiPP maturation protein [Methylophilus sp.]|uniref:HvfC family RiPP maturation protein n=1 Tax=Methylophilus sp. TaxID=29541 RepID=UPI004035671C